MIRRNLPLGTDPQSWLLISQIEHARLSYLLAELWGRGEVSPVIGGLDETNAARMQVRREVLQAIEHHDDGWASWEAAPMLDPARGEPLDFMEMPQSSAVPIWDESIRAARGEGPLAGWMVAGHFLALLEKSNHPVEAATNLWRNRMVANRSEWSREWFAAEPELHTYELAKQSLRWLQLFDWLSLWLCCTCPIFQSDRMAGTQPLELTLTHEPAGSVQFVPTVSREELAVRADPWPFSVPEVLLTGRCQRVPAKPYGCPSELVAAFQPAAINWRICQKKA